VGRRRDTPAVSAAVAGGGCPGASRPTGVYRGGDLNTYHGYAADRLQHLLRARFQPHLKRGVDMTSGVKN
jgi:hypothetical protein